MAFSRVIMFKGTALASAEKISRVGEFLQELQGERPIVLLCSMGYTTDNLLRAGERAARFENEIDEWKSTKELHLRTVGELGLDRTIIDEPLGKVEALLKCISLKGVFTVLDVYCLVSLGESMCARIFEAHLNGIGVKARRYEASDYGFLKCGSLKESDFGDAYSAIARQLQNDWSSDNPILPIVTGFPREPWRARAMTTFRQVLELQDSQVWGYNRHGILAHLPEGGPVAITRVYEVPTSDNAALQIIIPSRATRVRNNRVEAPHQEAVVTWLRRVGTRLLPKVGFGLMLVSLPLAFTRLPSRSGTPEMPDAKNLVLSIYEGVFVKKVYSFFGIALLVTANVAVSLMRDGQSNDMENIGDI